MPSFRPHPAACRAGAVLALCALLAGLAQAADADEFPQRLQGDLGLGAYATRGVVRGDSDTLSLLPYADVTYGRFIARVDTLSLKTLKIGNGHLELVARVSQDGLRMDEPPLLGLDERVSSVPLGLGTLQVTPIGGFWLNAFHDLRRSGGNLFELIYGGRIELPRVRLYPLLGAEYRSKDYVRYYYGVSAAEAVRTPYAAYQPGGAVNGLVGLIADIQLSEDYHLQLQARRKWLGDAIARSPLVERSFQDSAYLALSYRFR